MQLASGSLSALSLLHLHPPPFVYSSLSRAASSIRPHPNTSHWSLYFNTQKDSRKYRLKTLSPTAPSKGEGVKHKRTMLLTKHKKRKITIFFLYPNIVSSRIPGSKAERVNFLFFSHRGCFVWCSNIFKSDLKSQSDHMKIIRAKCSTGEMVLWN